MGKQFDEELVGMKGREWRGARIRQAIEAKPHNACKGKLRTWHYLSRPESHCIRLERVVSDNTNTFTF